MPVTYSITGSILRLDLIGTYEPREITAAFLAALADPKCPAEVGFLLDVTRSESLETRPQEDIRRTAEFLAPHAERIRHKVAVVAERDVHFGLSRMGGVYSEGVGIETVVFRDAASAIHWLVS